jgi:hypothetical protein
MINKTPNPALDKAKVVVISLADAKRISTAKHYMKTWPMGAKVAFGLMIDGKCLGVMVSGYAPTTERKVKKWCSKIERNQYIELQRTWISDELGHNTESWMMSRAMKILKDMGVWLVLTHSGGCKDDVGFIFQSSGWLYFGGEPCNDFFLTDKGEYKNLVSAMRFGRVPKETLKLGKQAIGDHLFGKGKIINARRHLYLYPIKKGIRRRLKKISLPPPKNPAQHRFQQHWINKEAGARGAGVSDVSGSIPEASAITDGCNG